MPTTRYGAPYLVGTETVATTFGKVNTAFDLFDTAPKKSEVLLEKGWDLERDFGAPTDGTSDCTAALQNAINTIYAAGGGKLICNSRVYRITDVTLPDSGGYLVEPITIEISGSLSPQSVPFCPGTGGDTYDTPLPSHGTVFWANPVTSAALGNNLVSATQLFLILRNLQILLPGNPQSHAVSGGWLTNLLTDNVIVGVRNTSNGFCSTGKGPTEIPEPMNTGVIGISYPGEGNGGTTQARNTSVYGYGIGIVHSEHFIADNLTVFKNKIGVRVVDGWHAATYGRLSLYWNTVGLQAWLYGANQTTPTATKPVTRIIGNQVDSEETDEASVWYGTTYHVDDPYNRLRGRPRTHRMRAGVGISGPILRRGAALLDLEPVGSTPVALIDAVGFGVADSTTTAPNSATGAVPVVPRGAVGVSGLQLYVSTTTATDVAAGWNLGVNSVSAVSRITMPASGGRNLGLLLNYIDASNYIFAVFSSTSTGSIQIQKVDTGAYTVLNSTAFANVAGATYELRFVQRGGRLQTYIDGVLYGSYTMTPAEWTKYSAGVTHGIYAYTGTGWETGLSRWSYLRFTTPGLVQA